MTKGDIQHRLFSSANILLVPLSIIWPLTKSQWAVALNRYGWKMQIILYLFLNTNTQTHTPSRECIAQVRRNLHIILLNNFYFLCCLLFLVVWPKVKGRKDKERQDGTCHLFIRGDFLNAPSPLFSSKMIKGQQVNQLTDFKEQQLWLWHFFKLVLNIINHKFWPKGPVLDYAL